MIAALRARLNDLERRHPLRYVVVLVLACDAVLCVVLAVARPFA